MRIIGGRDYYDSARAYGADPSVVFVRTGRTDIDVKKMPFYETFLNIGLEYITQNAWPHSNTFYVDYRNTETRFELTPVVLYFCGKRYFGVKSMWEIKESGFVTGHGSNVFWNLDELKHYLNAKDVRLSNKRGPWQYGANAGRYKGSEHYLSEEWATQIRREELDWLVEKRLTIALRHSMSISSTLYNHYHHPFDWEFDDDCLKRVNFWSIMPPHQAFQEIAMWVGGVLPKPGNPMVAITDDKVKIHKAGFDTKTSFRKAKEA